MTSPCIYWPGCLSPHEGGCSDCPAEIEDDDHGDPYDASEDWPECPTCKGGGTVNPLTAPSWFLCLSATTCPDCDGTGECP